MVEIRFMPSTRRPRFLLDREKNGGSKRLASFFHTREGWGICRELRTTVDADLHPGRDARDFAKGWSGVNVDPF